MIPHRTTTWLAFLVSVGQVVASSGSAVSVRQFGAKGDGKSDDTQAIQAAIQAANKEHGGGQYPGAVYYGTQPEIIFPPGVYHFSKPIGLGGYTRLRGEGNAVLQQTDPNSDVVSCNGAYRLQISGLCFTGGRRSIYFHTNNVDTANVIIENCQFLGSRAPAIFAEKGSNSTFLKISDCVFVSCMQVLHNTCDMAVLRDSWITTAKDMKNKAAIENYDVLICENLLGVPLVNGVDQRWIDNHGGSVTCKNVRFGGEGGGFTPVVNYAKPGRSMSGPGIVIESSTICALGNAQRRCAVYCEEVPNQIVISNCSLYGVPAVLISPKIDLDRYFDGIAPGLLRFDVADNYGEFVGQLPEQVIQAAARRSVHRVYGDKQLSEADTATALDRAIKQAAKLPAPSTQGAKAGDHVQQTDPKRLIDITPATHRWDLEDLMDGTGEKNSDYLAVAQAGDDVVILRRIGAEQNWPHVLIRDVQVDLGKCPFLTWQLRDNGVAAAGTAVKVLDTKTQRTVLLTERHWGPFFDYQAYDLRTVLDLKEGLREICIKFYPLGLNFTGKGNVEPDRMKKGEWMLLDFVRLEAE